MARIPSLSDMPARSHFPVRTCQRPLPKVQQYRRQIYKENYKHPDVHTGRVTYESSICNGNAEQRRYRHYGFGGGRRRVAGGVCAGSAAPDRRGVAATIRCAGGLGGSRRVDERRGRRAGAAGRVVAGGAGAATSGRSSADRGRARPGSVPAGACLRAGAGALLPPGE